MIKGVIFDMDGTMFDTEPLSAQAWIRSGEKHGYPITIEMVTTFCGKTITAIEQMLRDIFGEDIEAEKISQGRQEFYRQIITEDVIPHKEGLLELLEFLKREGIPAAVSTSTDKATAEIVIRRAGVYDYFTEFVFGDMVERSKPAPDIFLKAAEAIGRNPEECLVVEDSPAGVLAGKAMGGHTILIPDVAVVTEDVKKGISAEMNNLHEVIEWIRKENAVCMKQK